VKFCYEFGEWNLEGPTERPKLNHVETPFSSLDFADKRLGFPKHSGESCLCETGFLSRFT